MSFRTSNARSTKNTPKLSPAPQPRRESADLPLIPLSLAATIANEKFAIIGKDTIVGSPIGGLRDGSIIFKIGEEEAYRIDSTRTMRTEIQRFKITHDTNGILPDVQVGSGNYIQIRIDSNFNNYFEGTVNYPQMPEDAWIQATCDTLYNGLVVLVKNKIDGGGFVYAIRENFDGQIISPITINIHVMW